MLNPHARLARTRLWALAVAAILVVSGLGASPASAAPGAPGGLSPAYTAVNATPVLQWDRVAGATSYRVEVDDSADFASQLYSTTTVNRRVVPTPTASGRRDLLARARDRRHRLERLGVGVLLAQRHRRPDPGEPCQRRRPRAADRSGAALLDAGRRRRRLHRRGGRRGRLHRDQDLHHQDLLDRHPRPADQDDLLLAGDREPRLRDQLGEVRRPHLLDRGPGQAGARRADPERPAPPASRTSCWSGSRCRARSPTSSRSAPTQDFNNFNGGVAAEPVKGTIKKKGSSKSLPAVVSLSSDKRTAKLNPKQNLKSGKTYIIKLTTGIKDKAGNALVAYKWTVKVK